MDDKIEAEKPNLQNLFQRVKGISDRIPVDFGGGSPITKVFLMAYVALEYNLRSYVEIGVYRGKSLFPMAYIEKLLGGKAYGIDAYDLEIAKEFDVDPSYGDVNGFLASLDFAQMYRDVNNLREELGLVDFSEIIKDDSKNAIRYFRENQIEVDMLHIDGNHDTQAVQADVDAYLPLVRDGGWIVMDDIDWDSVRVVYDDLKKLYPVVFDDGYFALLIKQQADDEVLPVSRLPYDAVYSYAVMASQLEEKEAILRELKTRVDEKEQLLNQLIAHTEVQGKAILTLTSQLKEHESRARKFGEQVNKRDWTIEDLSRKLTEKENEALALAGQVANKDQQIATLSHDISVIFQSTSWKVSRPVRAIKPLATKVLDTTLGPILKRLNSGFRPRRNTRNKKISVVVTSYNHEKYIEQCLDSILKQKGYFRREIIVGDDCSTDGTARIIERYHKAHPGLIKVLRGDANLGITKNLKRCLDACSGDYIAICEGDDYWLDKYKLQKQLEHLEDHPDYSMCFSSFLMQNENENQFIPFVFQTELTKEKITTEDLIEENTIGNFSCCMYRTETVRNLPEKMFDVFTVDWMFNMACGDQGPIGYLPEPLSVYRKHGQGSWTSKNLLEQLDTVMPLLETYNQILGGKYEEHFNKRKAHLLASRKRLINAPDQFAVGGKGFFAENSANALKQVKPWVEENDLEWSLNQTYSVDLMILDTIFPYPLSPFRYQEFISYLDHFPSSLVLTTGGHLLALNEHRKIEEIIDDFEDQNPAYAGRAIASDHGFDRYAAKLAYAVFLDNIWNFLSALEEKQIPFVFTLYPGGGFQLNNPASDDRLARIFNSAQFKKVIVTQQLTYDYLLEKNFCSPEQIELIYGVVTPLEILKDYEPKKWYGTDKERLDICFVAHKYMKAGIDKGYDLFIESARQLAAEFENIYFHVVGDFDETDLPVDGLEEKITFYGQRQQSWFDEFYQDKDIILSPNRPFVLLPGSYDGFPTASCTEAGLRKVAIFCTDILKLNIKFEDGKDIVIIQPEVTDIVDTIKHYHAHPDELRRVAESGHLRIREVYNYENQIAPRIQIIEQELSGSEQSS